MGHTTFVFTSERDAPFTKAGFRKMMARLGDTAGFEYRVHPHMLRHACGYALANKGHDTRSLQAFLGHKNIQHTVRYTELSPTRFKDFWPVLFRARHHPLSILRDAATAADVIMQPVSAAHRLPEGGGQSCRAPCSGAATQARL
jgi:hypothetical protein